MPIALIVPAALEAIKLATAIIEAHNKGMSQDELNAMWAKMQAHVRDANVAWEKA